MINIKKYSFLLLLCFFFNSTFCQTGPTIQWQNTIGGNSTDAAYSIEQTSDGGYIIGGNSSSNISGDKTEDTLGSSDFWIIKTDSAGNIQWQNTIGGNDDDALYSVKQTNDGGYILAGTSNSNISGDKAENSNGDYDYWIVKTNSVGNIVWQNTIGGNAIEWLYAMQQTTDGGYILGGYSLSDISGDKTENSNGFLDYWLVKTDSVGNVQWQNTIGGNLDDVQLCLQQTSDGGYVIGGYSGSPISGDKTENWVGSADYWILKTDSIGNILWQSTIGGSLIDVNTSIEQTNDGGYILGGYSISNISGDKTENRVGNYDYWIVKIDISGNIQWQNTIGGSQSDNLYSIQQTNDGGYIMGGNSLSNISGDKIENSMGNADYWIIKVDSNGIIQWQNTIGGNNGDLQYNVRQTNDGGYILSGSSMSNISGDKNENCLGFYDYWIIKLAPDTITSITTPHTKTQALTLFPNPTSDFLTITNSENITPSTIFIKDVCGKIVLQKNAEGTKTIMDLRKLSTGIYFVVVETENKTVVKKLIKQ